MYIFSSHYIHSISAQFKNLKPHRGAGMHQKINLLACRSVLSPVLSDFKSKVKLYLQILSDGLFSLS